MKHESFRNSENRITQASATASIIKQVITLRFFYDYTTILIYLSDGTDIIINSHELEFYYV